jgi:hypothetical protein
MSDTVSTPATEGTQAKHFTETQVEQIVKERLARDREARKEDAVTKAEAAEAARVKAEEQLKEAAAKIEALQGTSATAEEITKKVESSWQTIEAAIPDELKKLVPTKLSPADKIEYISQNHGVFFPTSVAKPNTPAAPNVQGHVTPKGEWGGFQSEQEFAARDSKGYLRWKAGGGS